MSGLTVLNIHRGADTGGWGIRMRWAFRRHAPTWTYRSVVRTNSFMYIQYPEDLTWLDAKPWWKRADVVHLHNDFSTARIMENRSPQKPAVITYHGSQFRANPTGVLTEQRRRGAIGLVSTLDLWLIAPNELEWIGSPYDLDWLASLR